jgi:uncharacterized protein (UPF0254 family)
MYMTGLALRALAPQDMTAAQRRQADVQLGKVAAAMARSRRRLAGWAHSVATTSGRGRGQTTMLAPVRASSRLFERTAAPVAARRGAAAGR